MNNDSGASIERALREEPAIEPSPEFAHRVMRSVRGEASARQAIGFPWGRLGLGVALSAAVLFLGPLPALPGASALSWAASPGVLQAAQWLSLALAGSLATALLGTRLASSG